MGDRVEPGQWTHARDLVLGALEAGTLRRDGELWRLAGRPPVSATLRELVSERMASLSASELAPVELLALAEPLRIDELTMLRRARAVGQRGGARVDRDGRARHAVRLAHPLSGETLRADLPALRAQRLRLQLAEMLQRRAPLTPERRCASRGC